MTKEEANQRLMDVADNMVEIYLNNLPNKQNMNKRFLEQYSIDDALCVIKFLKEEVTSAIITDLAGYVEYLKQTK